MDELESKLKGLPLRRPSDELDRRISKLKPRRAARPPRRVPLWSAVAVSVIMLGVGLGIGAVWNHEQAIDAPNASQPIRIEVICDSPTATSPFDLTQPVEEFPAGELEIGIRSWQEEPA